MKQYPRIYSLSTLGLIHHQEFDYLFHPFRTDFIGESGSGKSMIADLIQLIFVGSDAFESATRATGARVPEGMVLSQGGHAKTMGYAFLNIEMQPEKYLVIGSCIETGNKNVQAFIIQQGFDKTNIEYLDIPLSYKDFIVDDDIQPIDRLKDVLSERGLFCQTWTRLKKYHEILYTQGILPINLAHSERQLKDYAEILQSFSRGKLLDTQKSNSLKNFLFGKESAKKIYDDYTGAVRDMEAAIGEYGSNLKEIERVTEKQKALLELKESRDEKELREKEWVQKQLLFANHEVVALKKEITHSINEFSIAKQHYNILQEILNAAIVEIESNMPALKMEQQAAENKYQDVWLEYKQIEQVESWLRDTNSTLNQLESKYTEEHKIRSQKQYLAELTGQLKSKKVEKQFEDIKTKGSVQELLDSIANTIENHKSKIENKEVLKKFSNLNNPDSFAYWAIQQKRAFTFEEESAILFFQSLPRQKTNKNDDYIPSPSELINALTIVEKEDLGFWLDLKGIRRFIPYTNQRVFDTTDTNAIQSYFMAYSDTLEEDIRELSNELSAYNTLQAILLNLSSPLEGIAAYRQQESILGYSLTESLNVSKDVFDRAIKIYQNKSEITTAHSETKFLRDELNEKASDNNAMLKILKTYKSANTFSINDTTTSILNNTEYIGLVQSIDKNYSLTKDNIQSAFNQSLDKSFYFQKSLEEIKPKLSFINDLPLKRNKYDEEVTKLEKATHTYQKLYAALPDNLISEEYITAPDKEYEAFIRAETNYYKNYKFIIDRYIPTEAFRLEEEDNFNELAKNLLPEAFHTSDPSNQPEASVIDTIASYLHRINDKNRQLNNRKIQKIKDLLHEVDVAASEQENIIRRIDNFLKSETNITGGYKARLKRTQSALYPKEWMTRFREDLEDNVNNLASKLSEKIDLENMMITAFLNCGGLQSTETTVQKLLDPSVYYEIQFNMESETGRVNKGSTGQTYAAIALLCIARLSVMDKDEGKKQQAAVRIMPIDEAEGLGSNYDMLHDIAKTYDYQIISLSIGPVGKFKDGEQYLYMLHKNMESEEPVNYTPMAILSEADKDKINI
jgi:hypothetical protein